MRGLHAPILTQEIYDAAQERHAGRYVPKTPETRALSNPLAGLVVCHECGHTLQRKPSPRGCWIFCPTRRCKTIGILEDVFERAVLEHLQNWLVTYSDENAPSAPAKNAADAVAEQLQRQKQTLQTQLSRLYDLLEQGVYTTEIFLARQRELTVRLSALDEKLAAAQKPPELDMEACIRQALPRVKAVLDAYPAGRNCRRKECPAEIRNRTDRLSQNKAKYPLAKLLGLPANDDLPPRTGGGNTGIASRVKRIFLAPAFPPVQLRV